MFEVRFSVVAAVTCWTLAALPASQGRAETVDVEWTRAFGVTEGWLYNVIHRVVRTTDGNLALGGNTSIYDGGPGIVYLARTSLEGELIWEKTLGEGAASWVEETQDGGHILATWGDSVVMKTDAEGAVTWALPASDEYMRFGNCAIPTADAGYIACGSRFCEKSNGAVVRLDASGRILWNKIIGEPGNTIGGDWSYQVLQTKDGGFAVLGTGTRSYNWHRERIHITKLDPAGEMVWEKFFALQRTNPDAGYASGDVYARGGLLETETGDLVAAGWGWLHDEVKYYGTVVKVDASGSLLWHRDLVAQYLWSLATTSDGAMVVVGQTPEGSTYLARLEADGALSWEARVEERPNCEDCADFRGRSILRDEDGGFIVGGEWGLDAALIKVKLGSSSVPPTFVRGDANGDGEILISDPVFVLLYLYAGTTQPGCLDAADTNDDGVTDLSDAIYSLTYQFRGGQAPPAPFPACGLDEPADSLGCLTQAPCP